MRVLAIDTSNLVLSVAVVDEVRVLAEITTNMQKNHSVRLMDCISSLLDELQMLPDELEGMAVAKGPGSYTGVRIGVATAKSMAWSLGIPVVGISSLEAVAANAVGYGGPIVPLFDARRGQVYTGMYKSQGTSGLQQSLPEQIILLREWLPQVKAKADDQPILFLGEDLSVHRDTIVEMVGTQAQFGPGSYNHPRAANLGFLAIEHLSSAGNPHELMPEYLQVAEAEAKWLAKNKC